MRYQGKDYPMLKDHSVSVGIEPSGNREFPYRIEGRVHFSFHKKEQAQDFLSMFPTPVCSGQPISCAFGPKNDLATVALLAPSEVSELADAHILSFSLSIPSITRATEPQLQKLVMDAFRELLGDYAIKGLDYLKNQQLTIHHRPSPETSSTGVWLN